MALHPHPRLPLPLSAEPSSPKPNAKPSLPPSILVNNVGPRPKKSKISKKVWWPDEEGALKGFSLGPPKQLEDVYVLEGLGPARGDTALQYMSHAPPGMDGIPGIAPQPGPHSFAEQVR